MRDSTGERPPYCGGCDERTRQLEVGDDARPVRCPRCHPAVAASTDIPPSRHRRRVRALRGGPMVLIEKDS